MGASENPELTEELRQQRVKFLGPRSETLSDLQLELLAEKSPARRWTRWKRKRGASRSPALRHASGGRIQDGDGCPRTCREWRKWSRCCGAETAASAAQQQR